LDNVTADPPPPPPPKKFKGEKGKKGRKGEGKGKKGGGQKKGADRRQDAQWAQWSDSSWDDAGAWWSGGDSAHDWSSGSGRDIILLSLFDGAGAAPYIIDRDFGRPRLAVSWEVDRACKALVQKALPWVEHRGDFTRDSPSDVADLVLDADPNAEAMVVWCAAPPCQDFSRIAQGAGHQGNRGRLFEESVAFMDELRAALKSHRFAFLYENVEMSAEAARVSSEALGVQPVFVCPSDFGWVSRPRLWWLSIEWTCLVSYPDDGSPLEWAKKGRWDRLRLAAARASADSFDLGGLAFHSSVAQGRKLMPCATTPAPTDDGRAKPRSTRGRTPRDADARWLEGGRQFAPWHYTVEAMLQDARGVLHIPPPE
ncbi:unnamed protein product, partial [Symbiodinium sp. KB8]